MHIHKVTKKEKVERLLSPGADAAVIAELAGCTKNYVYKIAANQGIQLKVKRELVNIPKEMFKEDVPISDIANKLGMSPSVVRNYAYRHKLPFERRLMVGGITHEQEEVIDGMLFLGNKKLAEMLDLTEYQVEKRHDICGADQKVYTRKATLRMLVELGAEKTAEKLDIDAEPLHNMMYVNDYGVCPYTNKPVELPATWSYILDKALEEGYKP